MVLNKYDAAGSAILTATIWDNQMNDVGSQIEKIWGVDVGSTVLKYDSNNNVISGNHFSTTGSYYERLIYDGDNNVASGILALDGKTTTSVLTYDSNNNITEIKMEVS